MERCWFSLSKKPRIVPIIHRYEDSWVRVTGHPKHGIATIYDQDLLIYVIAQYMHALNLPNADPNTLSPRFLFTGYDFYNFTGKKRLSGKGYSDLWSRLERLHHTFVETNIRQGIARTNYSFNWLSAIKQVQRNGRHRGFEIVLPHWLYDSVIKGKMVLTLDNGYFDINSGLERWLYLFARKAAGYQTSGWMESVESLHAKSGSTASIASFKRQVKKIVERGSFLGYDVSMDENTEFTYKPGIHFLRDSELTKLTSTGRKRRGAIPYRKTILPGS